MFSPRKGLIWTISEFLNLIFLDKPLFYWISPIFYVKNFVITLVLKNYYVRTLQINKIIEHFQNIATKTFSQFDDQDIVT